MKKIRLTLIFVGRSADRYVREGCQIYEERIRRYADLNPVPVPEERVSSRGKINYILQQEGRRIREKVPPGAFTVALDERGKQLSSEAFSRSLERWGSSGSGEIAFLLGGPYGLEEQSSPHRRRSGRLWSNGRDPYRISCSTCRRNRYYRAAWHRPGEKLCQCPTRPPESTSAGQPGQLNVVRGFFAL